MTVIPIFLSSDNNYAPFITTTIASICDNTKALCKFYILDGNISLENKLKIESLQNLFSNLMIEFIEVNYKKYFKEFKPVTYLGYAPYARFFVPDKAKKIIYLDVDIIALNDIKLLWEFDLKGKTIAIATNTCCNHLTQYVQQKFNIDTYCNNGVMLIDTERYYKNNYLERLLDAEKKYRDTLKFADQDLINIIFKADYTILPNKFNVQYGGNDTILRHFTNVYKPWKSSYFKLNAKISPLQNFDNFWFYARMTPFYEKIKKIYEESTNSSFLNKRLNIKLEKRESL